MIEDEIKTIADQIIQIPDDLGAQVAYLLDLSNIKWGISDIMPRAKMLYNQKYAEISADVIEEYKDKKIAITTLNGIIKGKCASEQKLVDICDRINSTINLQSQNLRTIISFKKTG